MLLNLHKKCWTHGLSIKDFDEHSKKNEKTIQDLLKFSKEYKERLKDEENKTAEELVIMHVGKLNPKKHLESSVGNLMAENICQSLGSMLATVVF